MIQRDYLIIGTGIAGVSACEGIREHDKKGGILLAGREAFPPYERFALSKAFLKSPAKSAGALELAKADWFAKNRVELRTGTAVRELNLERRLAVLQEGQVVEFRKALFATGSRPRRPQIAGANLGNVFFLNSLRDAMAIRESGAQEKGIVVVGGGLLALETAAALCAAKHKVTLLNRNHTVWQRWLDAETSAWLTRVIAERGVKLMMGQDLNGFEGKTLLKNIQTKSGERFPVQMAVVAVGAEPNLELVLNTPLASPAGTPVNDYLETDEKGIFAAGDVALYPDRIFGGVRRLTHWDHARSQGRVAGANMTGKKRVKFESVPFFWSELFDLKLSFYGDFSLPPAQVEITGERARKKFAARYFRDGKLVAAVLCNQPEAAGEAARAEIRKA